MIEKIDGRLTAWVKSILDDINVTLSPPSAAPQGEGVNLYLLELVDAPPMRGGPKRPPLQLGLRYLVTTRAKEPEAAHQALGKLVLAAMEQAEFEVELNPVPTAVWTAFEMPPQPSFILRALLQVRRPEPDVPVVRKPVSVSGSPMTQLNGLVLGPSDVPLARARVELPMLQLSTQTDNKGRFRFTAVPAEPTTKQLRIKAKGKVLDTTVDQVGDETDALTIYFNVLDG